MKDERSILDEGNHGLVKNRGDCHSKMIIKREVSRDMKI